MAQMRVMGAAGHTTYTWDPAEVAACKASALKAIKDAEQFMNDAMGKGAAVFATRPDGSTERIRTFDPTETDILVALPIQGG